MFALPSFCRLLAPTTRTYARVSVAVSLAAAALLSTVAWCAPVSLRSCAGGERGLEVTMMAALDEAPAAPESGRAGLLG